MKRYENMCVDCPPEIGCLGNTCPMLNVPVYSCDVCNSDGAEYKFDEKDYCEDCLNEILNDDFSQLSPKEKAKTLGYNVINLFEE